PVPEQRSIASSLMDNTRGLGMGLVRGAKDVVDTGADFLSRLGGSEENARIKAMNEAGKAEFASQYGDNTGASIGRFGGNVLATMPVGGVLAQGAMLGAKAAPTLAPMIANSLRTGGMRLGTPAASALSKEALRNAAIRIGGGAASGGAMAGLVNPDEAGTGALLGGAIPVAGKLAGESGKLLKDYVVNPLFRPGRSAISSIVADAGGIDQATSAINKAMLAGKTLSGESYTLGQAGKNWGLSATERARAAVNPENYQRIYQAQRDARIAAMQRLAGGADDATRKDVLDKLITNRTDAVNDLYAGMQDKPFMLGAEGEKLMTRARPYGALTHAEKLSATQGRPFSIPVVEQVPTKGLTMTDIDLQNSLRPTMPNYDFAPAKVDLPEDMSKGLLSEIRRLGGVSMKDAKDLLGEKQITKMGVQGGVFTKKGEEVGDMVRRLVDNGFMPSKVLDDVDGGAQALRDEMQRVAGGFNGVPSWAKPSADYGVPDSLPGAFKPGVSAKPLAIPTETVDRIVKGSDLQSVKEGIDQVISKAEGPQMRAMMQLKTDYLKFMESKSPEYIKANNIFSDKSKPITQMAVSQRMLDALTGEAAKHGGEAKQASAQFLQAYKNIPLAARSVSGMKQTPAQVFTPDNLQTVRQIAREISKHQDLQNLGRAVGSDTAQKLARSNMLTVVRDTIKASPKAMAALNLASAGAKGRIDSRIDLLMQNPKLAAQALAELGAPQRDKLAELLANPVTRAGLLSIQSR
ncbi:hypothetical protein UFOVP939_53, partial [uncultured Caudovirales phage]